jgi:hypothetical protein
METIPSNRSVWQGGNHLSITPEDSASEVWVKEHPRAPEAAQSQLESKQHRGRKTKFPTGEALPEVGEGHEAKGETKEKSEERFREEIRRVWSSYQTRMTMINDDMEKTPGEKEKVRSYKLCQFMYAW